MNRLGVFVASGIGAAVGAIAGSAAGNVVRGKQIGRLNYGPDELIGAIVGGAVLAAVAANPTSPAPASVGTGSLPTRFP